MEFPPGLRRGRRTSRLGELHLNVFLVMPRGPRTIPGRTEQVAVAIVAAGQVAATAAASIPAGQVAATAAVLKWAEIESLGHRRLDRIWLQESNDLQNKT